MQDARIKLFEKSVVFQASVSKERTEDTKIVEEADTGTYGAVDGVDNTVETKQGVRAWRPAS
jgi:hypothetical protein